MMNVVRLPKLYPLQRQAFFNDADVSCCEASTKAGKSVGALSWILYRAIEVNRGKSLAWVSPVYPQAKVMYRRVRRWLTASGIPKRDWSYKDTELCITVPNGATIWFKGSDNPDSIYGTDFSDAVIDEASRCKEDAYFAVRSTLTATRGMLRCIGNVKGRGNWFYRLSQQCKAGKPGMHYSKITAYDAIEAGVLDRERIEADRSQLPEHIFRELYLAEPSDDASNPFGYAHIAASVAPLSTDRPTVFGIDLAKSRDWCVVVGMDANRRVCVFERWQALAWPETIRRIREIVGNVPALIDATGVGSPVYDELRTSHGNYTPYVFTSATKQALIERLAVDVQRRSLWFPDGPIRSEMEAFEYTPTRIGVRYEAPSGLHDDCVVALALANFHYPASGGITVETVGRGDSRSNDDIQAVEAQRLIEAERRYRIEWETAA